MNWEKNISSQPGKKRQEKKFQPNVGHVGREPIFEDDPGHQAADELLRASLIEKAAQQSADDHDKNEKLTKFVRQSEEEDKENRRDRLQTHGRQE